MMVTMYFLIYMFLDQFAKILFKTFSSMFMRDIGLQFSFLRVSLSGFDIRVMLASQLQSITSCTIFWKSLCSTGIIYSLIQNSPLKPFKTGIFFVGRFFLKKFLLEYSCFTTLCQYLLYSKVNQLYVYIHPLFFGFPSHLGHHRALSRVPCATQQVLISYLFYIQQCVYFNPNLPIHPTHPSHLGIHVGRCLTTN